MRYMAVPLSTIAATEYPAFEGMNAEDLDTCGEGDKREHQLHRVHSPRHPAAHHRLDMFGCVELPPGRAIGLLELLARHVRMAGCYVVQIVNVHVGVHPRSRAVELLVILGPGKRCQDKEL